MMKRFLQAGLLATLTLLVACTNDTSLTNPTSSTGPFHQLDSMGRPLIVEIYTPWADHDSIVRGAPANDTGKLATDITTFVTTTAGRSAATAAYDQGLLASGSSTTPATGNVLVADMSQTGPANYLAIETKGKSSPTGSLFGGRALPDDVVDIDLGLAFGNLPTVYGAVPDDGKEQNGTNGKPNLASDGVTPAGRHYQIGSPYDAPNFPYLEAPL